MVIERLLVVRRELTTEQEWIARPKLSRLINEFRGLAGDRASHERKIKHSIERSQAGTVEEICEDTRLHPSVVAGVLADLNIKLPD